ncbi:MAG: trypsin-like peptidase domain-containing protein [Nanoarchaeota archaeon]|nr:trypsin-like peptidase domain-containing protein [Nanoarchaeota archaeon]
MELRRHHKILLGSFSSLVVIFMIVVAILLNGIILNQRLHYKNLNDKIEEYQASTSNKISYLSENVIETKASLTNLDESFTSELNNLKVSVTEDFSSIIENSIKSVVTIRTDIGQGTGFVVEENGYVITNAHVLTGGKFIQAITYEQETKDAQLIGHNEEFDLALLKISGKYAPLILEEIENVQIGEKVIAIGNPLGLQFSVTEGIISGVHRRGINGAETYIQTDAALNPGNSGGPLIDKSGNIVGLNNFKISDGESIGFALESDKLKEVINEISKENFGQTLI